MPDQCIVVHEAATAGEDTLPDALSADIRALWGDFGKRLFGNLIGVAIVVAVAAFFLRM
ncbi:MAG: hypothetical protein HIU92_11535 [Proteobacteria bacterium]|nr:hypothetical protein [Pseudomonadota bacterium]